MTGFRWQQKPPIGTPIDWSSPLAEGLVWHAPLWEGTGPTVYDVIGGTGGGANLAITGGATWSPGATMGLSCAGTSGNVGASATLPVRLKLQPPYTIAVAFRRLGASIQYGSLFGLWLNNTNANPPIAVAIEYNNTTGGLSVVYGTQTASSGLSASIGTDHVAVFSMAPSSSTPSYLYLDGVAGTSSSYNGAATYLSTALIGLGNYASTSGFSSNSLIYWAAIWGEALPAKFVAEYLASYASINQLYKPRATLLGAAFSPYFYPSPTSLFTGLSGGASVALSGFRKTWTPGTPGAPTFSESGVSGVAITAQTVSSTNAASLTITTGSTTGTLSLSDGTTTALVNVIQASFAVSPSAIPANHAGHITLTLTGNGTSWQGGTTVFTISGVTGATKVSQSISSTTAATLVITTGSGTGTLVVSDGVLTNTTSVDTSTFGISITSGNYTIPPAQITATGSAGSLWLSETASTLFSTPGTSGDSISSISVSDNQHATFTLNPGTATGTLTITEGPTGATAAYTIIGPGSLRFLNQQVTRTAQNTLLSNRSYASFSFFIKFNAPFASGTGSLVIKDQNSYIYIFGSTNAGGTYLQVSLKDSTGTGQINYTGLVPVGSTTHVAMSWNAVGTVQSLYFNGAVVNTTTTSNNIGYTGALYQQVGEDGNVTCDWEISDLAIWTSYALTQSDVFNLRDRAVTPGALNGSGAGTPGPATSWWQFGGPLNGSVSTTDLGLQDLGSPGGYPFTNFVPSLPSTYVEYGPALYYVASTLVASYVSKSGQLAMFFGTNAGSTTTPSGTVSIVSNTKSLSASAPRIGWIGSQIQIAGDSSSGTYTIVGGSGRNYTISPAYGGMSNALNVSATLISTTVTAAVTSIASAPTIQVQFGGTGSFNQISIMGPLGTPVSQYMPFAIWQLLCGPVQSIVVQNPGHGFSSPTTTITGGGGSGLTLGTPVMTGGVTSYTKSAGGSGYGPSSITFSGGGGTGATASAVVTGGTVTGLVITAGGSGYTSPPTIAIAASPTSNGATATATAIISSGGAVTGAIITSPGSGYSSATVASPSISLTGCTLTSGSTSVTGISSTSGLLPGMSVLGAGTYSYTIASIVSSTAITLNVPATLSGSSVTLTVIGRTALATLTVAAGAISAVTTFTPGTGYLSGSPPTISIGVGGTGASFTSVVTNVIGQVPITNPGSGYTSAPTITIGDGGSGTGATCAAIMAGVQPTDVVRYSAANSWLATAAGPASTATNASIINYSGQLEPGIGTQFGSALPSSERTLQLGMNYAFSTELVPAQVTTNWMTRAYGQNTTAVVTSTPDYRPITVNATAVSPMKLGIISFYGNAVDPYAFPEPTADGLSGRYWTFICDDLNATTPFTVNLIGQNCTIGGGNTSNGTLTNGVNNQLLTIVSGGSGYTNPIVSFTGGGGSGAAASAYINANGVIYMIVLTATGAGYTSAPTVVITDSGPGSGASATCTVGQVLSGRTWQWTIERTGLGVMYPGLSFYSTVGGTYPYTMVGECLFSPQASAAAYPSPPSRSTSTSGEPAALAWMTTSTPKYASCVRLMDTLLDGPIGGPSLQVDPSDLRNPTDYSYSSAASTTASTPITLSQNPTGTRTIPVSAIRSYVLSTSCVSTISLTALGTGYVSPLSASISDSTGTGASVTPVISGGHVTSLTLNNGGYGYSSPTISFSGGTGSGAAATATVVNGVITAVSMTNNGTGYNPLTVTITDPTGTGANATAITGQNGVTAIAVSAAGSGYTTPPVVTIIPAVVNGITYGSGASAIATVSGGAVTGITITSPGSGYSYAPTVAFYGGSGTGAAAGTVTLSGSTVVISNIVMTAGGSGYTNPTVTITGGGGSGATATATVGYPSQVVGGVLVTAGGSGYTSAPTVSFSGGGGSGASAVATISNGAVSTISMTNMGSGYTSAPTVSFSGGGGTGAAATAYIWNVNWSSPNVYLPGPGSGGSTVVSANGSWPGYGSVGGGGGGPYVMQPTSQSYLDPFQVFPDHFFTCELVTTSPHNLKTGQYVGTTGNTSSQVPYTNGFVSGATIPVFNQTVIYFVTGPNTLACVFNLYAGTTPLSQTMPGQMNTVSGSFPVTMSLSISLPDECTISYESAARFVGSLPGTNFWCNIPTSATDATIQAIARKVRDNFPKGRQVWVEHDNEHWNTANWNPYVLTPYGALGAYTNGYAGLDVVFAAKSCHMRDLFVGVFNQTDVNGNSNRGPEIKLALGGLDINTGITANMIGWANQQSPIPVIDAVAVAPYPDCVSEAVSPSYAATVTVSGTGGNLPAGTYYVYYTWVDALSGVESTVGSSQASFTQTSGAIPVVTISFKMKNSSNQAYNPSWGPSTANIYLTAAGGASGTATLYASGVTTTTYSLSSASWTNGTKTQAASASPPTYNLMPSYLAASAAVASHWPTSIAYGTSPWSKAALADVLRHMTLYNPLTLSNHLAQQKVLNSYLGTTIPLLVAYEGSLQTIIPTGVETGPDPAGYYLRNALSIDLYYDPNFYDVEQAFELSCQYQGFSLFNMFDSGVEFQNTGNADGNESDSWSYGIYHAQPTGRGDGSTASNGLAVTNQSWNNTQLANNGPNVSTRLKAWQDWADSTSPLVIPGDVFVTPANGATSVSPRVVIVVEFNEPMLGSTITTSTWTLKLGSTSISGTVLYSPVTWAATFTPSSILDAYATYTAQITTGVTNAQGTALANPITWTFTTGAGTRAAKPWFSGLRSPTARLTV